MFNFVFSVGKIRDFSGGKFHVFLGGTLYFLGGKLHHCK